MSGLRGRVRQLAGIGGAIALASVAGQVLLILVGRSLSPAQFALFVAFWGVLFGLGGSLSTLEQETARRTAEGDLTSSPSVGAVTWTAAAVTGLVGLATLLPPVSERLYGDAGSALGVLVAVAAVGFAVQFTLRGSLVGGGRTTSYAWLVVAEAFVRLAAIGVMVVVGLDLTTAAIAVAAGSFAWLGWARRVPPLTRVPGRDRATWSTASRRAGSLMATSALTAALVTGYPTLVALLVGTRDAGALGALFAALTLSRVPLLLVSPIQAVTVPAVVGWRAGDGSGARTARRVLVGGTLAAVGVGLVAAAAGWWIGPWLVAFVYTASYDVPGAGVALLLLAACLLAWLLLLSAALIALAAHRRVVVVWAGAVAATVLWLLVSPLDPLMTTAVGTVVGPCVGLVLALPHLWSHLAPVRPVPTAAR